MAFQEKGDWVPALELGQDPEGAVGHRVRQDCHSWRRIWHCLEDLLRSEYKTWWFPPDEWIKKVYQTPVLVATKFLHLNE